jgi:hypothetical protein
MWPPLQQQILLKKDNQHAEKLEKKKVEAHKVRNVLTFFSTASRVGDPMAGSVKSVSPVSHEGIITDYFESFGSSQNTRLWSTDPPCSCNTPSGRPQS